MTDIKRRGGPFFAFLAEKTTPTGPKIAPQQKRRFVSLIVINTIKAVGNAVS